MSLLFVIIKGFWIIIPAYVANASAPLPKGEKRMDFEKKLWGNELFGAGKTWEGFITAVLMGTLVGAVEVWTHPFLNQIALERGFLLPEVSIFSVFVISVGAMVGDLIASFIKRRSGLKRGARVPLLDQLDFAAGGLLAVSFFIPLPILTVISIIVMTPPIHKVSNLIGHRVGAKEVPW